MNQLTEYYKIIQRVSSLYAGEGDDELARQAVNAITPLAKKGNTKAQYMLGRYYSWGYHHQCDNQKAIYWFEKAADKGSDKAAEALANLYRYDFGDDRQSVRRLKRTLHTNGITAGLRYWRQKPPRVWQARPRLL